MVFRLFFVCFASLEMALISVGVAVMFKVETRAVCPRPVCV